MTNLYKVTKILDKTSGETVSERKMCGQPSWPNVFREEAEEMYQRGDYKNILNLPSNEIWIVQDKLKPRIGSSLLFVSVKLDAGWFRTAPVRSVIFNSNGNVEVTTDGSVYLCEIERDQ